MSDFLLAALHDINSNLEQLVELKREELALLKVENQRRAEFDAVVKPALESQKRMQDTLVPPPPPAQVMNLVKEESDGSEGSDTVFLNGTKMYIDSERRLHRCGGPAMIAPDGTQMWYYHGRQHREGGPAVVYPNGEVEYWIDDVKRSGPSGDAS